MLLGTFTHTHKRPTTAHIPLSRSRYLVHVVLVRPPRCDVMSYFAWFFAFGLSFAVDDVARELVWATSWGVSTRLIGAMVMTHSDDLGLRLPPAVAPQQVKVLAKLKG